MAEDSVSAKRPPKPIWRSLLLPTLVIAAISFSIWWLDYRPDGGNASPISGEEYGPRALPVELAPPGASSGPQKDKLAPDFLLPTLDGADLRLSDLRGQAVLLNFWATWCAPCRREIPQFVAAYDQYRDQGLVIVAVNVQEGKDTIRRYAEDFGMDFPVAIDASGKVVDSYRLLGLPTTYFIDRDGVVRSVYRGPFLEVEDVRDTQVQDAIGESALLERIREILG